MPIIELADKQHNDKNVKKLRGTMACVVQLKWHEKPRTLLQMETKSTSVKIFQAISNKKNKEVFGNVIFKKCREYSLKRVQH